MTKIWSIVFACAVICSAQKAHAQSFWVQLSAYDYQLPDPFFVEKGIENHLEFADKSGIYWYYVGSFANWEEADSALGAIRQKGFANAIVIDEEEIRVLSETDCPYIKDGVIFMNDPNHRASECTIYFESGKFGLSFEARETLDELSRKLRQAPKYNLKIKGFTDAMGDGYANLQLAAERSRSARDYLIYKGIHADRMFLEVFGEASPAAPNSEDDGSNSGRGKDLPENRKWNRRVTLTLELN